MAFISFAVTAKLICVFVFAYAKSWFSHNEAHLCFSDTSCRSRLASLNEKLTQLERRVEFIEARVCNSTSYIFLQKIILKAQGVPQLSDAAAGVPRASQAPRAGRTSSEQKS